MSTIANMKMGGMEYLRLPDGMTTPSDVEDMASLKTNNTALKMVGANNESNANVREVAIYSFVANSTGGYKSAFPFIENAKSVRMAGTFGDNDLIDHSNNNTPIFGWNGPVALWDFTGATFTDCTIPSYTFKYQTESGDKRHFDIDDPFKETEGFTSLPDGYETNSFYYFKDLATYVLDIKLPTGLETLPPACLTDLGAQNKANYMAVNGMEQDSEFYAIFGDNSKFAPIESLVIPDNYVYLDHECAIWARIQHLYVGSGVKEIRGGAFVNSITLEDLDFAAGISDCYIGNLAFGECRSMKHIALAEGIVSLGANAFSNSQHLESIRLPETLLYIGNEAFNNCLALNSITIPSNVEKIGQMAFCLCPFTDIYLTTTDPDKIPYMWSAGLFGDNSGGSYDGRASFNHGHFDGWEGFSDHFGGIVNGMPWDKAAEWYYINVNGLPVLHYPEQLADKVKACISSDYEAESEEGYGLPANRTDMSRRSADYIQNNYQDVDDLIDSDGKGQYTQNGWTQFVLMKEYVPGGEDIVYTKEYNDVWYTMCFPFDLTDEQLAAAFNETFNIADFSGVQIKDPSVPTDNVEKKTLVLHFNKVAVTYYKDANEKVYYRLCDDSTTIYRGEPNQKVWREQHGNFKYNVYVDPDDLTKIYHHVDANDKLTGNKTKTFALGNTLQEAADNKANAIIIDGILAEAGHPYMIHPAIGVNPGQPKKACNMSGITWLPEANREARYNLKKRTVDLGKESTQEEKWDNYDQKAYNNLDGKDYTGNQYTFIGNYKDFKDGWQNDTSLPTRPSDAELVEPKAPVNPNPKPKAPKKKELSEPSNPEDNPVDDPSVGTTYPEAFKTLYNSVHRAGYWNGSANVDMTYGEDIISLTITDFGEAQYAYLPPDYSATFVGYKVKSDASALKTYWELEENDLFQESDFNELKSLCQEYKAAITRYNNYQAALISYPDEYDAYIASKTEWDTYRSKLEEWNNWTPPADEQAAYQAAYSAWETAVENYNTWKTAMGEKGYNIVIPQYAYFLGTPTGAIYPKYFRQMSNKPNRSTGLWTQYSAIITPNQAALDGLETDLDRSSGSNAPQAKSHDIAFDEPFFVEEFGPQGITTLIEKIEKEEGKAPEVEYMDIVVSIDGKIVSRDKTTFEGLPKGVYIINGKKYYVK